MLEKVFLSSKRNAVRVGSTDLVHTQYTFIRKKMQVNKQYTTNHIRKRVFLTELQNSRWNADD